MKSKMRLKHRLYNYITKYYITLYNKMEQNVRLKTSAEKECCFRNTKCCIQITQMLSQEYLLLTSVLMLYVLFWRQTQWLRSEWQRPYERLKSTLYRWVELLPVCQGAKVILSLKETQCPHNHLIQSWIPPSE